MAPDLSPDASPAVAPIQRHGVIEVDTFCAACHYNLHGQAVTIDDRLNLPVCRCPECGRFHAAGAGVSASTVWVRRLATVMLYNWIGIVLVAVLTIGFFMGVLDAGAVGIYAYTQQMTPDGQLVEYRQPKPNAAGGFHQNGQYVIVGTDTVAPRVLWGQRLFPIFGQTVIGEEGYDRRSPGPVPWFWLSAGSFALGLLAAVLGVSMLWHWPRGRYAWCLLLPMASLAVLGSVYLTAEEFALIRHAAILRSGTQTAVQGVGIVVGLFVGRPIARALVRTVIPPKPRQALAFLWQVDGKQMPVA